MNPLRTPDNNYVLDGDPKIWGPAYQEGVASRGDNGTNCVLCGKRTGGKRNTAFVLASHRGTALPVAELPEDLDETGETLGCFPIGSECRKKIRPEFVIPAAKES